MVRISQHNLLRSMKVRHILYLFSSVGLIKQCLWLFLVFIFFSQKTPTFSMIFRSKYLVYAERSPSQDNNSMNWIDYVTNTAPNIVTIMISSHQYHRRDVVVWAKHCESQLLDFPLIKFDNKNVDWSKANDNIQMNGVFFDSLSIFFLWSYTVVCFLFV